MKESMKGVYFLMKKNVLRVISLILVAGMLMTFCSCTQTILVRFVTEDGKDIDLSVLGGGSVPTNNTPATDPAPTNPAPSEPATSGGDNTPTETPSEAPTQGSSDTPAAPSGVPSSKDEIVDFYKKACAQIKDNAAAGYTKKEFQTISNLNITGIGMVDTKVADIVGGYMTTEDEAEDQISEKGSDDAKNRFPGFTLTDYSKVASAECTQSGSNYSIKIVMQDEDTPKKSGSFLTEATNSLLLWEDIEAELANVSIISGYSDVHIIYKGYLIEAEITPDGHFVSMKQTANVDIQIGSAKILIATLNNKSAQLTNYATYSNFSY